MGIMLVVAVAFLIALPQGAAAGVNRWLHLGLDVQAPAFQAITGAMKLTIVVSYLLLIRRVSDIRRVFQYHGAEHKTISTYEAEEALTVENARAKTTLHPRCGTTFLVMVALVSIVVFTAIGAFLPRIHTGSALLDNLVFFFEKLPVLPAIAGLTFELQRVFARYCTTGPLRALLVPGFLVQKITTIEPGRRAARGCARVAASDALSRGGARDGRGRTGSTWRSRATRRSHRRLSRSAQRPGTARRGAPSPSGRRVRAATSIKTSRQIVSSFAAATATTRDLLPPRLGRYAVRAKIGDGGMATVYLGRPMSPARPAPNGAAANCRRARARRRAFKVIKEEFCKQPRVQWRCSSTKAKIISRLAPQTWSRSSSSAPKGTASSSRWSSSWGSRSGRCGTPAGSGACGSGTTSSRGSARA